MSVGYEGIRCQLVMQVYGVSWLCKNMVSVGYAGIWCQMVMQVYGISWLCRYMVSVGYAAIWCQLVMQLYGVSWLCSYMVVVITLPLHLHKTSAFKTSVYTVPGRGRQFPPNNIKLPISFELVNNQ